MKPDELLEPLIQRMAEGDGTALRSFVEQVGPWLSAVFVWASPNSINPSALLELALAELWRTAPLYDAHLGSPTTWVSSVARCVLMESHASRQRTETPDDGGQGAGGSVVDDAVEGLFADSAVQSAVASLTQEERNLLEGVWKGSSGESSSALDLALRNLSVAINSSRRGS